MIMSEGKSYKSQILGAKDERTWRKFDVMCLASQYPQRDCQQVGTEEQTSNGAVSEGIETGGRSV